MADIFKRISLKTKKEVKPNLQPSIIVAYPDGGFLIQYKNSCWVSRYDTEYNLLWQKEIGTLTGKFARFELTVSPEGKFIGVHGKDRVLIYDGAGTLLYEREHWPWKFHQSSGCYFAPANKEGKKYILFFIPENDNGGYLQAIDAEDFSLVDSVWQDDIDYHYYFKSTPDKDKVFIELAAGQDGSQLLEAHIIDQKISLKEYPQCGDLAMGSFSPTGKEVVFAPHLDEAIEIFSFPHMEKVAEVDQEKLFEGREEFPGADMDRVEYVANFISASTIMVKTGFGRLLLIDRNSLQCMGELLLEGCNINAYDDKGKVVSDPTKILDYAGEIWDLRVTEAGQILIIHTSHVIKVYDLPKDL
jgi:hypothetical protein